MSTGQANAEIGIDQCSTLNCNHEAPNVAHTLRGHSDYGSGNPCLRSEGGDCGGASEALVTHTLRGEGFDASEDGTGRGTPLVVVPILEAGARTGVSTNDIRAGIGIGEEGDPMFTLQAGKQHAVAIAFDTTQITSAENRSNPQPGDPCHPLAAAAHPPAIAFSCKDHGTDAGEIAPTLRSMSHDESHANGGGQVAIAFRTTGNDGCYETGDKVGCLNTGTDPNQTVIEFQSRFARNGRGGPSEVVDCLTGEAGETGKGDAAPLVSSPQFGVRRLVPKECEKLQSWSPDWTLFKREVKMDGNRWIVGEKVKEQADSARYKQCGNGVTTNVAIWIAQRIAEVIQGKR